MTRPRPGLAAAVAAAVLASGALAPVTAADEPSFREEVSVLEIEIPVQVLRGHEPVRGLAAEDFLVFDDGERREIVGFRVVDLARVGAQEGVLAEDGGAGADDEAGATGAGTAAGLADNRSVLVLFDFLYSRPQYLTRSLRGVREMVAAQLHPADRVAVGYLGESGARLIGGFSDDRQEIGLALDVFGAMLGRDPREAVERYAELDPEAVAPDGHFAAGEEPFRNDLARDRRALSTPASELAKRFGAAGAAAMMGDAGVTGAELAAEVVADPGVTAVGVGASAHVSDPTVAQVAFGSAEALGASLAQGGEASPVRVLTREIARLATLLRDVPGQRQLLYLSEGFASGILNNFGSETRAFTLRLLERMFEALRKGGWTLHAIDIQGVPGPFDGPGFDADSLFYMANETGGQLLENFNLIHEATALLIKRTSLTYVLTIRADGVPNDGQLHRLEVKLRQGDGWRTRVLHRTGYYAPEADRKKSPLERRMDTVDLLLGKEDVEGFGMRMRAATLPPVEDGFVPVPVVVEVPLGDLLADRSRRKVELEAQVYALDGADTVQDLWIRSVHVDLAELRRGPPLEGLRLLGGLALLPGEYRLRTLVREVDGESRSLKTAFLSVPAHDAGLLPVEPMVLDASPGWLALAGLPPGPGAAAAEALAYGDGTLVPAVAPRVSEGEPLEFLVVTAGGAEVELAARVLDGSGRALAGAAPATFQAPAPTPSGALVRHMGSVPTTGLPPGSYTLEVAAQSPSGAGAAARQVRFEIWAGG